MLERSPHRRIFQFLKGVTFRTPARQCFGYIILLCLSGCGFHLRGFADVPHWLNHIAIIVQTENRHLEPLLTEQLQAYKIIVTPPNAKPAYRLVIEKDALQKQMTNVSASQTPRQYLLLYSVQFTLISSGGVTIMPSTHIIITRQFTLNNDRILGSNYEEMTFKREMEREAAAQIISRLSTAKEITLPKKSSQVSHAD